MAEVDALELAALSRDRICWQHPGLASALERLKPELSCDGCVETFATDGEKYIFNPDWAREAFFRAPVLLDRALLHALAHCLLGHVQQSASTTAMALACDVQAAVLSAELAPEATDAKGWPMRELMRRFGRAQSPEAVMQLMEIDVFAKDNLEAIRACVSIDSHALWRREPIAQPRAGGVGDGWGELAARLRRGVGSGAGYGTEAAGLRRRMRVGSADARALADYLKRYSVVRENPRDDPDSFQYAWYAYGMAHYGNVPLIEPLEYREERRIDALVIVIDTSGSCTRGLTRRFLELVRGLLAETGLFFRHFNLRIIQCDAEVQRDDLICDMRAFERYIENLEVIGGSGTDFRPALHRIDTLLAQGRLRGLKGVLCFSDGRGIYPAKAPDYEVTFVFLKHRFDAIDTPAWVRRLVIDTPVPRHGDPDEY